MTRLVHEAALVLAVLYLLVPLGSPAAPPKDPADNAPKGPILYRQHLMSEDLIATHGKGFLPMLREKFETAIRDRARSAPQTIVARINRAKYEARLENDLVLRGRGDLEVSHNGDSPASISLSPCALAIGMLRWSEPDQSEILAGVSSTGEFLAVVDRNGTMQFDWSLNGIRTPGGEREFVVKLPRSPQNTLQLELPAHCRLTTGDPTVVHVEPVPGDSQHQRWTLELGGRHEITIRVVNQSEGSSTSHGSGVREAFTYRVATSGVELLASFRVDCSRGPVRHMTLVADAPLQISAARIGDKAIPLQRTSSAENTFTYDLVFAESLYGTDAELIVTAIAPTVTGKEWRLPKVRMADIDWISNTTTLEILSPLSIASFHPKDSVERKVEPLPLPQRGELRECHGVTSDHALDVQLELVTDELVAETGTTLRFSESSVAGQIIADLRALRGEPFELRAAIQPGWVIDSVQTDPPELLEGFQTEGGRQQTLRVRLREAARSDRLTRLIVRGRRSALPLNLAAAVTNLRFIRWHNVLSQNELVAFQVEPPLRLSIAGDLDVTKLDPGQLGAADASRLGASTSGLLFRDGAAVNAMTVSIAATQPTYSAQIVVEARIDASSLSQISQLRIVPDRSHVGRVVVRFSKSFAEAPTWELVEGEKNAISTRRLDLPEDAGEQEQWEVILNRPLNSPFTLRAVRKSALERESTLALAAIPEASAQSGTVRIVSTEGAPLEIDATGLSAVSTARPSGGDIPTLCGVYRYEPSQNVRVHVRRPDPNNAPPSAWIWWEELTSRISGAGELRHDMQLFIENNGLPSMVLTLPTDATVLRASAHGVQNEPEPQSQAGKVIVALPKGVRFPVVRLTFLTRREPIGLAGTVRSVWPVTDLPCWMRHWTVWTPADLEVASHSRHARPPDSWDKRLLGVQLTREGIGPFDPFSASQWRALHARWFGERRRVESTSPTGFDMRTMDGPWSSTPDLATDETAAGWNMFTVTVSGTEEPTVFVYGSRALTTFSWGAVLLVAGIFAVRFDRRKTWVVITVVAVTFMLLVLPDAFLPPLRGILYGALIAWGLAAVSRRTSVEEKWNRVASRGELSTTALAMLVIGVLTIVLARQASAQAPITKLPMQLATGATPQTTGSPTAAGPTAAPMNPNQPASSKKPVVYPILVPIDETEHITGDYIYVPESLFDELHRDVDESNGISIGPLIRAAHYSATISPATAEGDSPLPSLTAEYQLGEAPANGRLQLAFRRDQTRVIDVRADGTPVLYEWDEGGRSLRVALDQTRNKLLQVMLTPIVAAAEGGGFAMAVPRVPNARVTVRSDSEVEDIQVPSAIGGTKQVTPHELEVDLGPADELRMSWRNTSGARSGANNDVDVRQLIWMRVQPNAVAVDAQFHFVAKSGQLEQVEIEVDPLLRLLPVTSEPWVHVQETEVNGMRILRCLLAQPFDRQATLNLSFALNGGGVGNLRVPRLVAVTKHRAPVWLGVTVADELSGQLVTTSKIESLAPAEFARIWSRGAESPQMAWVLPSSSDHCLLNIRPQPRKVTAEQQVEMTLGNGQVGVTYEGLFTVEQGALFQQRFHVPALFTPREVTVIHDDIRRLLRWSRADPQTLVIFFNAPLTGGLRIWVKGELPLARSGQAEIPVVCARDVESPQLNVRVFQLGDVQAKSTGARGLVPEKSSVLPTYRPDRGRFVESLVLENNSAAEGLAVQLSVRPNRPNVRGSTMTILRFDSSTWKWDTSVNLDVRNGTVDTIRMRLPAGITGPVTVEPAVTMHQREVPGEDDRELVLRLSEPAHDQIALRVRGELTPSESLPVASPDIQLLDFPGVQRFVALPRVVERRPVVWDMTGLQAAEWPSPHEMMVQDHAAFATYQIVGQKARAVLKGSERIGGPPKVRLADYRIQWFSDQRCHGTAAFDIDPSSLDHVDLEMPEGTEWVHVSVGGIAVVPRRDGTTRWRIPIALEHFPQRIEVFFHGGAARMDRAPGVVSFAAPQLIGLPYARTLWSVEGPREVGSGDPVLKHARVDGHSINAARLEQSRLMLAAAEADPSRDNSGDFEIWRSAWQSWVRQLESDEGYALRETRVGSRRWMTLWNSQPRFDWAGQWSVPTYHHSSVHGELLGEAPQFSVYYEGLTWYPLAKRAATVVAFLILAAVAWRVLRSKPVRGTLLRYPQLAIGLIGVTWWLWLAPSGIGLLILITAVVLAFRPSWKMRPA